MWMIKAVRDFAEGLARGVSLFFNERSDHNENYTIPEAAWPQFLDQGRADATRRKPR
jgi:hypothetical protein